MSEILMRQPKGAYSCENKELLLAIKDLLFVIFEIIVTKIIPSPEDAPHVLKEVRKDIEKLAYDPLICCEIDPDAQHSFKIFFRECLYN